MNRLVTIIAVTCGIALFSAVVKAETVEELKHELAVRKAYISKLERRVHELEKRPSRIAAPVAAIPARPSGLAPPSPPEDAEMERALERTLVREGALVLAPWSYELTPQFSFAHWDKVQDPTIRNSYSAGLGFRMGLPWQSQVSVWLPYVYSEGKDGFPSSSGLGDAGIVFSKELNRLDISNQFGRQPQADPIRLGFSGWFHSFEKPRPTGCLSRRLLLLIRVSRRRRG